MKKVTVDYSKVLKIDCIHCSVLSGATLYTVSISEESARNYVFCRRRLLMNKQGKCEREKIMNISRFVFARSFVSTSSSNEVEESWHAHLRKFIRDQRFHHLPNKFTPTYFCLYSAREKIERKEKRVSSGMCLLICLITSVSYVRSEAAK